MLDSLTLAVYVGVMRYALCVMRYALCVMRYALCVMRYGKLEMSKILNICTHIPSESSEITKEFFQEVLGFNVAFNYGSYIELEKEGLLIGIQQSEGAPNEQSIYIRMEGLDDFWLLQKDNLSKYNSVEPFLRDYGMKEIHVVAPETNTLLFLGESVNA